MQPASLTDDAKKRKVAELTRLFLHKHYCENDTELLLSHLDDAFSWFGAGEHEYAVEPETVIKTLVDAYNLQPITNPQQDLDAILHRG